MSSDDMAEAGTVSLGIDVAPKASEVAPTVDHMKRAWDMYTSENWIKIVMENCNDY